MKSVLIRIEKTKRDIEELRTSISNLKARKENLKITKDNYHLSSIGTFKNEGTNLEFEATFKMLKEKYGECQFESFSSFYWVSENKLIRLSDHWGSSIRSCDWFIEGFEKTHCCMWNDGWTIGVITFEDLTESTKPSLDEIIKYKLLSLMSKSIHLSKKQWLMFEIELQNNPINLQKCDII